jgi:hypothetical protein
MISFGQIIFSWKPFRSHHDRHTPTSHCCIKIDKPKDGVPSITEKSRHWMMNLSQSSRYHTHHLHGQTGRQSRRLGSIGDTLPSGRVAGNREPPSFLHAVPLSKAVYTAGSSTAACRTILLSHERPSVAFRCDSEACFSVVAS